MMGIEVKKCRYKKRRSFLGCGTKDSLIIMLSLFVKMLDSPNVHICPHIRENTNRSTYL